MKNASLREMLGLLGLSLLGLCPSLAVEHGHHGQCGQGSECRDTVDTVDLLQVGLSLAKDEKHHLDSHMSDGVGLRSHHTRTVSRKNNEKTADCPPMYPQCGGLKPICEDSSRNLLRLGTALPESTDQTQPTELLIDLTNALKGRGKGTKVQLLVMAMFEHGAYTDDLGYIAERASPEEDTDSALLEMALSEDGNSVHIFKPIMNIRTSDLQSAYAVKSGLGSTLIASLPRLFCEGEEHRIIIEAAGLLGDGFFVVDASALGSSMYVVDAKEFPKNFDITVDYGPMFPLLRVGYTVVLLPDRPMKPRSNDDRLLFFDTQYVNKGNLENRPSEVRKLSELVDSEVSMIWRYNIDALPNREIRFYVDPSVPKRWRPFFRKGIEMWNDAYTLIERPNAVKAILPEDPDWPSDFELSDARFNTISWDLAPSTFSMGIAKVDPRSGEIIKCDVAMGDSWVKAYLEDLELELLNFSQLAHTASRLRSTLLDIDPGDLSTLKKQNRTRQVRMDKDGRKARSFGFAAFLQAIEPVAKDPHELLGSGLQEVVSHEVGHCLGLRHNFKGSMGISRECLENPSCTAKHGTSASVMDYIAMNLPKNSSHMTHVWSPTIGAYDKLAIRYGYTHAASTDAEAAVILKDILREAESLQSCYDEENNYGEDPSCIDYDLSSDPVAYFDGQVSLFAEVQKNLLDTAVLPTQSYQLYGHAVDMILSSYIPEIGFNAASYLGGRNNSYLHKYEDQKRQASQPIPAATQRLALDIVLRLLRPKDQGLLPPDEAKPFLVESCRGALCSFDVDDIIRRLRTMLLQEVLGHATLVKLHRLEASTSSSADAEAFTLSELLSSVVRSVFAAGLDGPISDDEKDLQRRFVFIFTSPLVAVGSEHAAIMSQLQHYRDFTRQMVETALERLNRSMADNSASAIPFWNYCADYNQTCECDGLVRLQWPNNVSHEQWGAPVCLPESFDVILDEKALKKSWCECMHLKVTDELQEQWLFVHSLKSMLMNTSWAGS